VQELNEFLRLAGRAIVEILGKTATGRATAKALKLNRPQLVVARQAWVLWGIHPPQF
jgi:hypothetical protein